MIDLFTVYGLQFTGDNLAKPFAAYRSNHL